MTSSAPIGDTATTIAHPRRLRLVADDLTGALDTAAQFAAIGAPLPVVWRPVDFIGNDQPVVVDTGCRELGAADARATFANAIDVLEPRSDYLSFLKLDSLLRGHAADEIAACTARWPSRPIIVAPAFPKQRRETRSGRQFIVDGNGAEAIGEDIAATLRSQGVTFTHWQPGTSFNAGINLCDAGSDADLSRIVAATGIGSAPLWCGSAGLGAALAGQPGTAQRRAVASLSLPILGIFGTDHPVMLQQLAAAEAAVVNVPANGHFDTNLCDHKLNEAGVCLLRFVMPHGISRSEARRTIADQIMATLKQINRPGTLIVSGGETLRSVCDALGATGLFVDGEVAPGVPSSIMRDGTWPGVRIISKSGAFGAPDFLPRLLEPAPSPGPEEFP